MLTFPCIGLIHPSSQMPSRMLMGLVPIQDCQYVDRPFNKAREAVTPVINLGTVTRRHGDGLGKPDTAWYFETVQCGCLSSCQPIREGLPEIFINGEERVEQHVIDEAGLTRTQHRSQNRHPAGVRELFFFKPILQKDVTHPRGTEQPCKSGAKSRAVHKVHVGTAELFNVLDTLRAIAQA